MTLPVNPMANHATWDLVAVDYQADIEPQFVYFANRALELADVRPGDRIADVACGPGTLACLASHRRVNVAALDFSPAMIRCLNERAARDGKKIESVVASGMALPWPDQSFDACFSMFGLMFFPDRNKGFSELARVLKPNGRAVVSSWVPMDRVPLMNDIYKTLAKLVPGLPFGELRSPLSHPGECEEEMAAGGLCNVRTHECQFDFDIPSIEVFWAALQRSTPPVRLAAEKIGPTHWPSISRQVVATLTSAWGAGPQKVPLIANLTVGQR